MKKLTALLLAFVLLSSMLLTAVPASAAAPSGTGTYDDPIVIATADDFYWLTGQFESKKGSSSNDNTTYGAGMFFKQTADIDMAGYSGYRGTVASGDAKYGFSGVYDGGGHSIRVKIDDSSISNISIFPYVNGLLMNLHMEGSINSKTYSQPVRTIGSNGSIVNCSVAMTLTSSDVCNGLTQSNYGKVNGFYGNSVINGSGAGTSKALATTQNVTYTDTYYYAKRLSGSLLTTSKATQSNDYAAVAAALGDTDRSGIAAAGDILISYSDKLSVADLVGWAADESTARVTPGTVETPEVPDYDITVDYKFTGDEAALAGYAEGVITISAGDITGGRYTLYWGDEKGVLASYEAIASVNAGSDGSAEYRLTENIAIPAGADRLLVFYNVSGKPTVPAAAEYEIPVAKRFAARTPEFTFASVSDIHVNYNSSDPNSDNYCGAPAKWTAALNYFAELGLDMVAVSGDGTGGGEVSEYEVYTKSIRDSAYPAEKIYMARGNHDSQKNANFIKYCDRSDMVHPFTDSPWFYVMKKGDKGEKDNLFIFLAQELDNTSNTPGQDNFSDRQLDWLEALLKEYSGTNTNIFILEHAFYHNWGPGDRYDGVYVQPMHLKDEFSGNLRLQRLLIEYKEAVLMSGHSHIAFSEMVNFSDENGTACRMIHNSSTSQLRVYNASGGISYRAEGRVDNKKGSEGYVVGVYDTDIVYSGTNLTTHEAIPTACYIFPSYTENRGDAVSVEITKAPVKTEYNAGEFFDPKGMEVTATYADGSTAVVRGWGLSDNHTLADGADSVTVKYGELTAEQKIKITKITDCFEGKGTFDDPFIIATPEDFANLNDCFASIAGSSSNDNTTFGAGMYFRQTADIDMTGYAGYVGTPANGGLKYGFAGVYDGNGHSIKVKIDTSNTDASVFPYLNGVLMNVRFEGSIKAGTNASPVRTVGKYGFVLNCISEMTLSGDYANGLSVSNYGRVSAYYSRCALSGNNLYAFSKTNEGCTYTDAYHYCSKSGGSVSDSNGTRSDDASAIAEKFNDHTRSGITQAVTLLQSYNKNFAADMICLWDGSGDIPEMIPNYYPGDADKAKAVDDMIAAIGKITSLEKEEAVKAAREAYEKLTAEQKALVTKLDVLEAAEKAIAAVKNAEAAAAVDKMIEELGEITSEEQRPQIEAAREAYEKLTAEQKALVTKLNILQAAEKAVDNLPKPGDYILGDVDASGTVNVSDILSLKTLIMNNSWTEDQLKRGDINGDGTLTVGDMLSIKNIIMAG